MRLKGGMDVNRVISSSSGWAGGCGEVKMGIREGKEEVYWDWEDGGSSRIGRKALEGDGESKDERERMPFNTSDALSKTGEKVGGNWCIVFDEGDDGNP